MPNNNAIQFLEELSYKDKRVLVRLDINSPIDKETHHIVNTDRIEKSISTIKYLLEQDCKIVLIAHQGDTLDYQNLLSLEEHAKKLTILLGHEVKFINDVCGPYAVQSIKEMKNGEIILLDNLRYLTEEISTFENNVALTPSDMKRTWLYRQLQPLFDIYVNEAFSAAHRNAPSLVAFEQSIPTVAGKLFENEYTNLAHLLESEYSNGYFILGGAKISDAFGMMQEVLKRGKVDKILTGGVLGMVFLEASGISIGNTYKQFLSKKGLIGYIKKAEHILEQYKDHIVIPIDVAYCKDGKRTEINVCEMEEVDENYLDIGTQTIGLYKKYIQKAKLLFMNGPAGVYEDVIFEKGTKLINEAVAQSHAYSVLGGGDTISAASKFINLDDINYVSTAGGAMIQFLSGKQLPVIEAMKHARR